MLQFELLFYNKMAQKSPKMVEKKFFLCRNMYYTPITHITTIFKKKIKKNFFASSSGYVMGVVVPILGQIFFKK